MKEHSVLPKDVRAVFLISAARLGSGTAQIVVRRLAARQARVRIPARHPREALYWAKSNEETRVDPRRMDVWMNVLYEKNIENKQKMWLMPPNL